MQEDSFKKKIFLTFDDGPSEKFTPKILEVLKKYDIKATFFVCGKNIERYPQILRKIFEQGHKIGNHSFSHRRTFLVNYKKEIEKTNEIIYKVLGIKINLFRAPWLICPPWIKKYLRGKNFLNISATIDSKDWKEWKAEKIVRNIEKRINNSKKDKEIILFHDGKETELNFDRSQTVLSLEQILKEFLKKNYIFCTF